MQEHVFWWGEIRAGWGKGRDGRVVGGVFPGYRPPKCAVAFNFTSVSNARCCPLCNDCAKLCRVLVAATRCVVMGWRGGDVLPDYTISNERL